MGALTCAVEACATFARHAPTAARGDAGLRLSADHCSHDVGRLCRPSARRAARPTMASPCPLLGDGITDDTLLNIAGFLPSARDLLCLKLTNSRFAAKIHVHVIAAAPSGIAAGGVLAAAPAPEMLCIPEEAARLWVVGRSEQERGWVPRRGRPSWLCRMHDESEVLRLPLAFGRSHADVALSEGGAVATLGVEDNSSRPSASKMVMRSGCHFAQFTLLAGEFVYFGVVHPGWDVEAEVHAFRECVNA